MTTIKQANPPAIPAATQSLELIASRMTDARRDLLAAIDSDQVAWHRPPGNATPRTLWRKLGERTAKAVTVTGEVNWLRSHELATLGVPLSKALLPGQWQFRSGWASNSDTIVNVWGYEFSGFNSAVGNASPSKLFAEAGRNIVRGLVNGITDTAHLAVGAMPGVDGGM